MLYNKGNHAQLKRVQPQPSRLQGENGGKIYSTWNPGIWLLPVPVLGAPFCLSHLADRSSHLFPVGFRCQPGPIS